MANEVKYGDLVIAQNGFSNWGGGYLDTIGHSSNPGALYDVATSDTPNRGAGTGTWEITSATGKAAGSQVISGDLVHLRNLYNNDGGYLDVSGSAAASQSASAKYDVKTAMSDDRDSGSGSWRVFVKTSTPTDQGLRLYEVFLLWNIFGGNGGFLEVNGTGPAGDKYDVCTNAYWNRSDDVAYRRFAKPPA